MQDRFYFRQLLAGRDFAQGDPVASQMVNFVYLVGDRASGEVLLVDPAYAVRELVELAERDGMKVVGSLATHYHQDHVGGEIFGHHIEGVARLLELSPMPIHVNKHEAKGVMQVTGASPGDLVAHEGGDLLELGGISIRLLHTPGHTPGSQCFLVAERDQAGHLVAGDTLFLDSCGRVDLPGSDPRAMYESLAALRALGYIR